MCRYEDTHRPSPRRGPTRGGPPKNLAGVSRVFYRSDYSGPGVKYGNFSVQTVEYALKTGRKKSPGIKSNTPGGRILEPNSKAKAGLVITYNTYPHLLVLVVLQGLLATVREVLNPCIGNCLTFLSPG